MKVSAALHAPLPQIREKVSQIETVGYDMCSTFELKNDPFLSAMLAAEHTTRPRIATSIAVAFARSPMTVASTAWDLHEFSGGRFVLGLGSQIKAHITRRFSMPWSRPAARMREYVQALRAIWDCWENDEALNFRGEFYQHTLMTPMFMPTKHEFGLPQVHLAAVGPLMTQVAGEVADGIIMHGFTTRKYVDQVTLPALQKGLDISGRSLDDIEIIMPFMVASGADEQSFLACKQGIKKQLAFYGSTPAYKEVLATHGWEDLFKDLNRLSKVGRWDEMAGLMTDDILAELAIVEENPKDIAPRLRATLGDLVDVWGFHWEGSDIDQQTALVEELHQG